MFGFYGKHSTKGRFGTYLKFGDRNIAIPKGKDPLKLTLEEALALISAPVEKPAAEIIAQWGDIQVINGKYGPYIKSGNSNYKIPKDCDAYNLKEEDARKIIDSSSPTARKGRYFKKK